MNGEFLDALEQLQREKDIPMTALIETVEAASEDEGVAEIKRADALYGRVTPKVLKAGKTLSSGVDAVAEIEWTVAPEADKASSDER